MISFKNSFCTMFSNINYFSLLILRYNSNITFHGIFMTSSMIMPKLPLHKSTLPNTESIKPNTAIGSPKLIYLIYLFSMLYLEVGA